MVATMALSRVIIGLAKRMIEREEKEGCLMWLYNRVREESHSYWK